MRIHNLLYVCFAFIVGLFGYCVALGSECAGKSAQIANLKIQVAASKAAQAQADSAMRDVRKLNDALCANESVFLDSLHVVIRGRSTTFSKAEVMPILDAYIVKLQRRIVIMDSLDTLTARIERLNRTKEK